MSYDFLLFPLSPGQQAEQVAQFEAESEPLAPPDPEREARKRRVADALQAANEQLTAFPFDYEMIARHRGISVAEAREQVLHIELNSPEDGNGIQITLHEERATVTVPYWHGAAAEAVFEEIWRYLAIIQRETGYTVFDPQLGSVVRLADGHAAALRVYSQTRAAASRELPHIKVRPSPKRKWWQIWKRMG